MSLTVQCPHCTRRYLLPDALLGPRGARVRCPNCSGQFEVGRAPDPVAAVAASAGADPPVQRFPAFHRPHAEPVGGDFVASRLEGADARAAFEALDVLAGSFPGLGESWARGRLFAEAGPALLAAFDDYRRRAGSDAGAETFRAVLRARWGIVLRNEARV
jgi:predicted Zn finger-like uncharacterized protein